MKRISKCVLYKEYYLDVICIDCTFYKVLVFVPKQRENVVIEKNFTKHFFVIRLNTRPGKYNRQIAVFSCFLGAY